MGKKNIHIGDDVTKVMQNIDAASKNMREAMRSAAYLEFLSIMRQSLREVPVNYGRLRSTAYVTVPPKTGKFRIEMGYGTSYAVPVHENERAAHKPPTKSHYLSDPLEAAMPELAQRIYNRAWDMFKSGNFELKGSLFASKPKQVSENGPPAKIGVTFRNRKRKK